MRPNTFVSYSRQCIGFVDDLAPRLEKQGFKVWVDYRSLVPGRPWAEQIQRGLEEAELLLLVVSQESITSHAVELEWQHFLKHGKRIILLIFQAVQLPPELVALEWIDFRGSFSPALKKLIRCTESPIPMERRAPQSGFKAPMVVWLAAMLSVVTAVYSLFAVWTILIPWVLVPLPLRVFKRNFNFPQVQVALWTLPVALFFSLGLAINFGLLNQNADFDYNNPFTLYNLGLLTLFLQIFFVPLTSTLLLLILHSPGMQRWGKPEAGVPKFANIYHPNIPHPEPAQFHIDHAEQDGVIAHELAERLTKYGHIRVMEIVSAEKVLVLVSRFKSDSEADPEKQVVYPILVQRTRVSEKLSRVQWIDFRKGVRNLEAIAQLLPHPDKMLAALGVRPTSSAQSAMPNVVLALVYYLIIMGTVDLGSFLSYTLNLNFAALGSILEHEPALTLWLFFLETLSLFLTAGLIYSMVRALSERRGWFVSPIAFLLGLVGLFILFFWQAWLGVDLDTLFNKYNLVSNMMFAALPLLLLILGGLLIGLAALFRYKDLHRWFPAKTPKAAKK